MSCVLVIAGSSFIGRAVCAELRGRGRRVVATTRRDPGEAACDVLDAAGVSAVVERHRPDAIVQCAGVTDAREAGDFYRTHVQGTLNILEAVRRHVPASPVVLIGSAAEYGPVGAEHLPVHEGHPCAPAGFYGASKLAQTHLGQVAAASWGLRVRTARLFNVIGAGLPAQYFLAAIASRLRSLPSGATFAVRDLDATRDFVEVRDAATAIVGLLAPEIPSAVYNVASGIETSIREVTTYLGELAGGMTPVEGELRAGRVTTHRSRGDGSRLRGELGWQPRFAWREGVRACWEATRRDMTKPSF